MDFVNIERCWLIDIIVEPVGKEQICGASPPYDNFLFRVVVLVIIDRRFDRESLCDIASVFGIKGVGRILRMACHKDLATLACHHHIHSALPALGHDLEFLYLLNILGTHFAVAALWHVEDIVEATEDRCFSFLFSSVVMIANIFFGS